MEIAYADYFNVLWNRIIMYMYFFDDKRRHTPHVHAEYAEYKAVLSIETGDILDTPWMPQYLDIYSCRIKNLV